MDAFGWDAHGTGPAGADNGPCVSVEGQFAWRKVWLRVLAYAPEGESLAMKVDATGRRREA